MRRGIYLPFVVVILSFLSAGFLPAVGAVQENEADDSSVEFPNHVDVDKLRANIREVYGQNEVGHKLQQLSDIYGSYNEGTGNYNLPDDLKTPASASFSDSVLPGDQGDGPTVASVCTLTYRVDVSYSRVPIFYTEKNHSRFTDASSGCSDGQARLRVKALTEDHGVAFIGTAQRVSDSDAATLPFLPSARANQRVSALCFPPFNNDCHGPGSKIEWTGRYRVEWESGDVDERCFFFEAVNPFGIQGPRSCP